MAPTSGETIPLYFAAESAPTANIPPEAPLCYKFMVAGTEEQLRKLKAKYPGLYDDQITTNPAGGKNLMAKRRDENGKEITYFYSTSPEVCNAYHQDRLQTATPGGRGTSNPGAPPGEAVASAGSDNPPTPATGSWARTRTSSKTPAPSCNGSGAAWGKSGMELPVRG